MPPFYLSSMHSPTGLLDQRYHTHLPTELHSTYWAAPAVKGKRCVLFFFIVTNTNKHVNKIGAQRTQMPLQDYPWHRIYCWPSAWAWILGHQNTQVHKFTCCQVFNHWIISQTMRCRHPDKGHLYYCPLPNPTKRWWHWEMSTTAVKRSFHLQNHCEKQWQVLFWTSLHNHRKLQHFKSPSTHHVEGTLLGSGHLTHTKVNFQKPIFSCYQHFWGHENLLFKVVL